MAFLALSALALEDPSQDLAGGLVLWLGLFLLVTTGATAAVAWAVLLRLDALRQEARPLGRLEDVQRALTRLIEEREGLDLRRVEHLLVDLRDGFARLEGVLLRLHEEGPRGREALALSGPSGGLGERVTTRLLALGYERIRVVTPLEDLESLATGDGQVVVEARREGTSCKGRVAIREGRIDAVHLEPTYTAFP